MQTRTISKDKWQKMFDSISRIYAGATSSLEVLEPDLGAQMEIEEEPLTGISYDRSGLELHFTTKAGVHLVHRVQNPSAVMLEERDDGIVSGMEVDAPGEPRIVLRFSAPRADRLLPAD